LEVMRQDERAWLTVTPVQIPDAKKNAAIGKPLIAEETIVNTGKTPAFFLGGHAVIDILKEGEKPKFPPLALDDPTLGSPKRRLTSTLVR